MTTFLKRIKSRENSAKMLDIKTLQLLKCPISKSKLVPVTDSLLQWINRKIKGNICKNVAGVIVQKEIDNALVNEKQDLAIPIRAGVISMSVDCLISIQDYSE